MASKLMLSGILASEHHEPEEVAGMGTIWHIRRKLNEIVPSLCASLRSDSVARSEATSIRLCVPGVLLEARNLQSKLQKQLMRMALVERGIGILRCSNHDQEL